MQRVFLSLFGFDTHDPHVPGSHGDTNLYFKRQRQPAVRDDPRCRHADLAPTHARLGQTQSAGLEALRGGHAAGGWIRCGGGGGANNNHVSALVPLDQVCRHGRTQTQCRPSSVLSPRRAPSHPRGCCPHVGLCPGGGSVRRLLLLVCAHVPLTNDGRNSPPERHRVHRAHSAALGSFVSVSVDICVHLGGHSRTFTTWHVTVAVRRHNADICACTFTDKVTFPNTSANHSHLQKIQFSSKKSEYTYYWEELFVLTLNWFMCSRFLQLFYYCTCRLDKLSYVFNSTISLKFKILNL